MAEPVAWVAGAAGLAVVGALAQWLCERRDRRNLPAPGRLVRVADAELHVVVEGSGPVVLFDSGLGGSSIEWATVAADLAAHGFTVVRYDRPGFGWSPGSRADRRALAAASRIIQLLDALQLPGAAILVGHSLGGVHVRLAAALAPDRVSGLVLVDPSHEGMLEVVENSREVTVMNAVMLAVARTAPLGVGRLAGRAFAKIALAERREPLTPEQAEGLRMAGLLTSRTSHGLRALAAESCLLAESLRQLKTGPVEPSVPMTVITAAAPPADERAAAARSQIDRMHIDLVATRPLARHVLAHRSGHLIPLDQPEIVSQAVREMAVGVGS